MRLRATIGVALGGLLVTLPGCQYSPFEPLTPTHGEPPIGPPPSHGFPPAANPAGIYDRISASFIPGTSRYVLYDDSTFSLQYVRPDWGFFEYPGNYSRADSLLILDFDGWNTAGPWLAEAIVRDDSLIVKYNIVMQMADFEDGAYIRNSK